MSRCDSAFLEQIPIDVCASDRAISRKAYANKLAKTTRVIVALSLRVAKGFNDRVSLQYLALEQTQRGRFRERLAGGVGLVTRPEGY